MASDAAHSVAPTSRQVRIGASKRPDSTFSRAPAHKRKAARLEDDLGVAADKTAEDRRDNDDSGAGNDDSSSLSRVARRRRQNRESAARCRARQRLEMEQLQSEAKRLRTENEALRLQVKAVSWKAQQLLAVLQASQHGASTSDAAAMAAQKLAAAVEANTGARASASHPRATQQQRVAHGFLGAAGVSPTAAALSRGRAALSPTALQRMLLVGGSPRAWDSDASPTAAASMPPGIVPPNLALSQPPLFGQPAMGPWAAQQQMLAAQLAFMARSNALAHSQVAASPRAALASPRAQTQSNQHQRPKPGSG